VYVYEVREYNKIYYFEAFDTVLMAIAPNNRQAISSKQHR